MQTSSDANFNIISSQIQTLMYYLSRDYTLEECEDPRFISGRVARILWQVKEVGVFGEIHPQVLENWGIEMPAIAGEIDIEELLGS